VTAADIARYQRLGRYDYLVIDYLQRMPYKDRFELNAEIKGITTLARTAKIPILLLSQFSRQSNAPLSSHGFPKPNMTMFAETSVIEKEASMAMAVWRPRDENGEPGSEAEFLVMASRYSTPGVRKMHFDGDSVRFTEAA
jgi:replicative DNA helicase